MAVTYDLTHGFAPNAFVFAENPDVSGRKRRYIDIGHERYEFTDDPSDDGAVLVGADLAETLISLVDRINANSHLVIADATDDGISLRAAFGGSWVNGIRLAASTAITEAADVFGEVDGVLTGRAPVREWTRNFVRTNQLNAGALAELNELVRV